MRTLEQLGISKTPWSVEDYWYIDAADGTPVANVGKYDCAEADARLIAAAPMLYEALRKIMATFHDEFDPDYLTTIETSVLAMADAALAAASGESEEGEAK